MRELIRLAGERGDVDTSKILFPVDFVEIRCQNAFFAAKLQFSVGNLATQKKKKKNIWTQLLRGASSGMAKERRAAGRGHRGPVRRDRAEENE